MRTEIDRNVNKINKVRKKINSGREINRDIIKVFVFFAVLFSALIVFLAYFVAFRSDSVINNSYNRRSDVLMKSVKRGDILDRNGTVIAYSQTEADGTESRVYPYGRIFAHVVGFDTNGRSGIESAYNYYMLTSHNSIFNKISNEFYNIKDPGDSIVTTLDLGLQSYVYDILGGNNGAAICMDPDTGEIYAMVSKPDFDPNYISDIWDELVSDEQYSDDLSSSSVLINRATQGLYTPGSTFKIFTLYEYYLEYPGAYSGFSYDCNGIISVGDTTLSCYNGAHGHEDLKTSFANSCNCAFGTIAEKLDLLKFGNTCKKLLFDTELPIDIPSKSSIFNLTDQDTEFDIMATAIGQGNTQVTPLHIALIVSAIANNGVCMKPSLVNQVVNNDGAVIKEFKPVVYETLFSENDAAFLKEYLRSVVTDGTAGAVYPGNFVAYGKTGTAQKESSRYGEYDHSWFAGWAENDGKKLAVCVILENMENAGTTSVYLSKLIFDYYFSR